MNDYEFSLLKKLLGAQIIGFNQLIPELKDDNNRAMFSFDINYFSFEYCNPGQLAVTYLLNDKSFNCLTFKAENIEFQEEVVYPKYVIKELKYNSDCYYHYLINHRIIEIEIFSSKIDNSIIEQLINFKCDDGKQFLIECTTSMNGSIKLYLINQNAQELIEAKKNKLFKTVSLNM